MREGEAKTSAQRKSQSLESHNNAAMFSARAGLSLCSLRAHNYQRKLASRIQMSLQ